MKKLLYIILFIFLLTPLANASRLMEIDNSAHFLTIDGSGHHLEVSEGGGPYYVDFDAGDDTAAGTSEGTAWKYLPWMDGATGNSDSATLVDTDIVYVKYGTKCTSVGCRMNEHDNGSSDYITITGKSDWGTGEKPLICPLRSWTANWIAVSGLSNVYYHVAMADFAWIFWGANATNPGVMKEHVLDLDEDGQFSFPAIGTINYDNLAGGPFTIGETITGGTNGYTAKVLADTGSVLTVEQYSNPTIPYDNDEGLTGAASGATCDVNGANQPTRAYVVCVYSDTDLSSSPGTIYYSGGDGYAPFESDEIAGGFKFHKWIDLRIWGGGRGGLFYVQENNAGTSSGYIYVSGCDLRYNGTGSTFAAADSFNTAGIVIGDQNNAGTVSDIYIVNNTITDVARRGIMIGRLDGGTNYIGYNRISGLWGEHSYYFDRPVGIYTATTLDLLTEHNSIIYRPGEISSNEWTVGFWNMESVVRGGGNITQYNYIEGFGYSLFSECGESDDIFRENYVVNCLGGLIATGETGGAGIKSVKWYNNTVINASVYGFWHKGYQTAATEMELINNAFVSMNPTYFAYIENDNQNGTIAFDYNGYEVNPVTAGKFFWQADGAISFNTWDDSRDINGQCATDLGVDSNGIPQIGSILINNGTIPTGEESMFLLDPATTVISPWNSMLSTKDYGNREIGAFGFIPTVYNMPSLGGPYIHSPYGKGPINKYRRLN